MPELLKIFNSMFKAEAVVAIVALGLLFLFLESAL